jgi:hypothetical protein
VLLLWQTPTDGRNDLEIRNLLFPAPRANEPVD